ncbi:MAG TPA: ABC transporter substrate-binding protein [Alphaproteobacteria bacterium]|nr:ABC transporter substrate-binding protein [Alphaproteobacteria bacterium]
MKHMKTILGLAVAGSVLGLAAPAMADDIKIGILLGFTGPLENLSPPMADAAKLALKNVSDQGGIDGANLVADTADDSCIDASVASASADKLINSDGDLAVVGAMCSGVAIAAANNVGIPSGTVMVSPSATSPAFSTLDDKDLIYRTAPSDAYNGEVLAHILKDHGIDNIAITYINSDYGKGLADALAAAFTAGGGTVAANVPHEDGKADYRPELGQLAASGSTVLVDLAYANGSGRTILQQAIESGDWQTYVGGDGMVDDSLFQGLDASALEGMIAERPGTPASDGTAVFNKIATDGGVKPDATYAPQSYDAAFLIALAAEKTGGKKDGMAQALRDVATAPGDVILPGEWKKAVDLIKAGKDINYEGASGPLEFDEHGDVPGVVTEMTVKDGHFVEVGEAK